ncbi:MAG: type II secretion system F family protein [Aquihabitans sp.]
MRTRVAIAGALLVGLAAITLAPAASAQGSDTTLAVRAIDSTDSSAVRLTFLWTGGDKALETLKIREDGQSKKVDGLTSMQKTEQRMATVALVDLSASMNNDGALTEVKKGLRSLVDDMGDGNRMAIVSYSDKVVVDSVMTANTGQLTAAIDELSAPADGKAAMYDGLKRSSLLLGDVGDLQPNIVLVTDGGDDGSSAPADEARGAVISSGAALFAVDLTHDGGADTGAINAIIDRTGGAMYQGADAAGIATAFEQVQVAMKSQFVATYASTAERGSVDVSVSIGTETSAASYVVGSKAMGAATEQIVTTPKAFGPEWLRGKTAAAVGLLMVGLAVGLGVYALASLATKNETGLSAVLQPYEEGGPVLDEHDGSFAQTALLQRAVEITEDFAERQGFLEKIERMLERADLPLRAAEALFFYLAAVVIFAALAFFTLGFVPGLLITLVLGMAPPAVVNFLAGRRQKKFVSLLPDTLNLLSGSLRAGYSLMQGIEAVSQEVEDPMGKELRRVVSEARLGREPEDAMDSVAERMESPDFGWAVMAIRIQREVGGNLSELLLTVADTMVHRERLRRDVSALTAEGKISAIILGLLPIGLGLFMWLSNPTYMEPLGSTGLGQAFLLLSVVSAGAGFLWMKKIINVEI